MDKKEFLLFMVEVLNCSAQTESKTEKIKIIVNSAGKYLGIKDVSWRDVEEMLKAEVASSQSPTWSGSSVWP